MNSRKKYTDYATALSGMQRYCAYQERSNAEVRSRLLNMGVFGETLEQVIGTLIEENFLNEERFACAFARGKCRSRKWGRLKIENELKLRKVPSYCIQKAMKEIDDEVYSNNLRSLLLKKSQTFSAMEDSFVRNHKLFQYALQKGYESELIVALLKDMFSS